MAGGLVFIDRNPPNASGGPERPNVAMVGGFATDNDSVGGFAGHLGSWLDGRPSRAVARATVRGWRRCFTRLIRRDSWTGVLAQELALRSTALGFAVERSRPR